MRTFAIISLIFVLPYAVAQGRPLDCNSLVNTQLPHTAISSAEPAPAGRFVPPAGAPLDKLPEFCRVTGVIKPTSDSYIRFEVWTPTSGWNEKFLGVGNGGFAGSISYDQMATNLRRGYATAATDTGHEGESEDASWAFGHPEKVTDFGYRALHETTENAKELIGVFYGKAAVHSYFDSCSDGGREALMEAQRFPADFDGILAGAPANHWTHLLSKGIRVAQGTYGNPAGYFSSLKLPAINAAVKASCDAQDGVKDGIINDPTRCHFDPSSLLCKGVESRSCLTAPQIAALKVLYQDGGFAVGGEDGWGRWVMGSGPGRSSGMSYVENYFRYMVFENPSWNVMTASAEEAERAANQKTANALNAVNPDLRSFEQRGGKLILYHGWNDPAISPLGTIQYYKDVVAKAGEQASQKFVRLYMVPGMQHCIGGSAPNWFGQLGTATAKGPTQGIYTALEHWVENGTPPESIIATKFVGDSPAKGVAITRPLCTYPQVAKYKGSGDINDAGSFVCTNPE
jgi:feruloyl esterase